MVFSPILDKLNAQSLSKAVLKSSKIIVSVRSLKTKESFQKGLSPSGRMDWKASVTESISTIVKMIEKIMATSMIPKRGEMYMSSKYLKSYRARIL